MMHNARYIERLQEGDRYAYQAQGSRLAEMAAKADQLSNKNEINLQALKTKAYSFSKQTKFGTRTNSENNVYGAENTLRDTTEAVQQRYSELI